MEDQFLMQIIKLFNKTKGEGGSRGLTNVKLFCQTSDDPTPLSSIIEKFVKLWENWLFKSNFNYFFSFLRKSLKNGVLQISNFFLKFSPMEALEWGVSNVLNITLKKLLIIHCKPKGA